MPAIFQNAFSPLYALVILGLIALVAWPLSYFVPFFRRELAIEDRARLTPLDGLRGILCFAVMCHHGAFTFEYVDTGEWKAPPSNFFGLLGSASVALFFCVTAFLFWSRVVARHGSLPVWPFLRGRLFRLIPLYVASCLFALVVGGRMIDWRAPAGYLGLAQMGLMGLRPWGMVGGLDMGTIDAGVTWSLQYEWGFYLLLPALALMAAGKVSHVRRLWLVGAGAMVMFGLGPFLFFLPGILAVYAAQHVAVARWCRSTWASVAILAVAAVFPLVTNSGMGWKGLCLDTCLFVPIACGNTLFGLLTFRGLRLMGIVSYSVYLLHGIVLYAARPMLAHAKHAGANGVPDYWLYVAGLGCLTLVLSLCTFRWIEWPFIQFEKGLRHTSVRPSRVVEVMQEEPVVTSGAVVEAVPVSVG